MALIYDPFKSSDATLGLIVTWKYKTSLVLSAAPNFLNPFTILSSVGKAERKSNE